jgi:N6-adenosine-specific RNA methylase IME4
MPKRDHGATLPLAAIRVGVRHRRELGDVDSLARSIAEVGLLHPVVVTPDGTLIAGGRRLAAVQKLGWREVPVRVVNLDDIVLGEFAENVHRQDFLPSEIDAIRRALAPAEAAAAKARMSAGGKGWKVSTPSGKTRDRIGAFAGVSGRTVEKIAYVVAAAEREPRFAPLVAEMDRTRRVTGVHRKLVIAERAAVIAADPPWPTTVRADDPSQRRTPEYPSMTVDAICALGVGEIAHADSVLWLWSTNADLPSTLKVAAAWGFTYRTMLTWAKPHIGIGDYLRGQTEQCLLATRGRPTLTLTNQSTLLTAPRREHSRKPDEFYELVERLCPGSKVELFCRYPRPGWAVHGDGVAIAA